MCASSPALQPRPSGSTINDRIAVADRALRNEFPDAPCQVARGFHPAYLRRGPRWAWAGQGIATSRVRVKEAMGATLSRCRWSEVARFWIWFPHLAGPGHRWLDAPPRPAVGRSSVSESGRLVAFRSPAPRARQRQQASLPSRWLRKSVQLLDHYLRLERPDPCSAALFVSLKGRARGTHMTAAGLRSLFRHHRQTTGVTLANPHRFRHTFASDMVRAGVSLPALMQLMGHAHIQTTLLYVKLTPPRRLPAVCARRGSAHPPASGDCLVRRRPRSLHPPWLRSSTAPVGSLSAALLPDTTRHYHGTVRKFLTYLAAAHPTGPLSRPTAPPTSSPRLDLSPALANAAISGSILY